MRLERQGDDEVAAEGDDKEPGAKPQGAAVFDTRAERDSDRQSARPSTGACQGRQARSAEGNPPGGWGSPLCSGAETGASPVKRSCTTNQCGRNGDHDSRKRKNGSHRKKAVVNITKSYQLRSDAGATPNAERGTRLITPVMLTRYTAAQRNHRAYNQEQAEGYRGIIYRWGTNKYRWIAGGKAAGVPSVPSVARLRRHDGG